MISLPLAAFLAGAGVGLTVAAPIGPMGLLCIQRTLALGLAAGLVVGLAAATVRAAYGILAILGLSATVMTATEASAQILSLLSGAILFWFAGRVLRRQVLVNPAPGWKSGELLRSYRDALTFGFSNPLTVVLFFAAFPALATSASFSEAPALVGGVFTGSIGWFLALSSAVNALRNRLPARALDVTNKASGLVLAALGMFMITSAFRPLLL
ncbi:LysE family translocator [Microvirga massiliensis]|uniref:LysE family translocator n=1 Tax=Microvirga massiliensis TaxID=1033741 RepID=UPI00062B5F11|nr:LysE family transporter [Microvirga massiliensis]